MLVIEAVAALLIVSNTWLLAQRSIWNFAFGIAGVILYAWIFFEARLYSDALLQGFFVVIQIYGWRHWAQAKATQGEIVVQRLAVGAQAAWAVAIIVSTGGWGWAMHRFTDAAAPWPDASVAIMSVAAQILLTRQKIENWYLWIVVNIVSIMLYASRGLYVTAVLYCAMLGLSIWGLIAWRRAERARLAP